MSVMLKCGRDETEKYEDDEDDEGELWPLMLSVPHWARAERDRPGSQWASESTQEVMGERWACMRYLLAVEAADKVWGRDWNAGRRADVVAVLGLQGWRAMDCGVGVDTHRLVCELARGCYGHDCKYRGKRGRWIVKLLAEAFPPGRRRAALRWAVGLAAPGGVVYTPEWGALAAL